ncbi:bifunctional acetylglutamate kinase/N-acetyl-gamma-glutamyl-phosphate reductase [Colletotrichum sp. SAR11_240]|nr:bifunctional acetylglutamate kinase/N-acetyl-gamma-glutamyl-phosphate reductase [Colletotrichum sp. SAR11_240]
MPAQYVTTATDESVNFQSAIDVAFKIGTIDENMLANLLAPLEIVYSSEKGGLYDKEMGRLIKAINLDKEYDEYMKTP